MRWLVFVTPVSLFSFCYAQKYDTSGALTLSVGPSARSSCGGCNIDVHYYELDWYDQAYTHVAATIVKFVNNATNVTITSSIPGSSFTLPESAAFAGLIVSDSVITTIIGGIVYTLTYPRKYHGIGGIERYSQSPITNANGTVKCVVSKTAMTNDFLLREDVSNGLELSAFIGRDIDRQCEVRMASPPQMLVRVSSLTATTTNYIDNPEARTSSAMKALPSISLSPPTVPRTESSRLANRPTVPANPPPRKTVNAPLIATQSTPAEPTQSDLTRSVPPAATLLTTENLIRTKNHDAEPPTKSGLSLPEHPQDSSNGGPASLPAEPTLTVPISQASTATPSLQPFGIAKTIALSLDPSLPLPTVAHGSSFTANPTDDFPIGNPILSLPNGAPATTPISLGSPDIVISTRPMGLPPWHSILTVAGQKSTAANPSDFSIGGTAEIHRGGPSISISGARSISMGISTTIVLHNSNSTPLAVLTGGVVEPASQLSGLQPTATPISAPPPTGAAAGNHSEPFVGAQLRMAEVPMVIMLGSFFFGIAAMWGLS